MCGINLFQRFSNQNVCAFLSLSFLMQLGWRHTSLGAHCRCEFFLLQLLLLFLLRNETWTVQSFRHCICVSCVSFAFEMLRLNYNFFPVCSFRFVNFLSLFISCSQWMGVSLFSEMMTWNYDCFLYPYHMRSRARAIIFHIINGHEQYRMIDVKIIGF